VQQLGRLGKDLFWRLLNEAICFSVVAWFKNNKMEATKTPTPAEAKHFVSIN
jgi:hypothetical protein